MEVQPQRDEPKQREWQQQKSQVSGNPHKAWEVPPGRMGEERGQGELRPSGELREGSHCKSQVGGQEFALESG